MTEFWAKSVGPRGIAPLFSVITVVLNAREQIEETILSVVGQSFRDFEYIVVDGGSSDGTLDIIRKHGDGVDRWVTEPDSGIYDAFNKGISLARGAYVGLLNAGDRFVPGALQAVASVYACGGAKGTVVCGGLQIVEPLDGTVRTVIRDRTILGSRFRFMFLNHPSTFVPRTVYERVGLYDSTYRISGDFEFAHRLLRHGIEVTFIPEVITVMRAGGVSSRLSFVVLREFFRVVCKYGGVLRAVLESARAFPIIVARGVERAVRAEVRKYSDIGDEARSL